MNLPHPPELSERTKKLLSSRPSSWETSRPEQLAASNEPPPDVADASGEPTAKKSAATLLVDIAQELYEFGVSDTGDVFAIPRSGPKVVRMLRGGKTSLRAQLAREYFERYRKAAPQQALADALLVVEGHAQDEEEQALHLRVAEHNGALWLDLGDATGRAIRITSSGYDVQDTAPVLFKRTTLTSPLPDPVGGGSLDELWQWLNVTKEDRPLVIAWLIAALHATIPHPVLGLFGEQGTGKTTAEKLLVSLVDPSPVPTRKPPRDADSWVTAASGSWVVGLDNLSDIPPWLSDSICRAVTGDGDVRRKLYTDGDMAVFSFRRAIVVTGIDLGALRGDLAERMVHINLDVIPDHARLEEDQLWPRWSEVHPRLLGALLELAAGIVGILPSVRLESKPRMADFARVLAAVDIVLGTRGLDRFRAKQGEIAADSLMGDPFVVALADAIGTGEDFSGTSAEILAKAIPADETWRRPRGWPKDARAVTQLLRKQAPVMRKAGWTVDADRGGRQHTLTWTLIPPDRPHTRESAGFDARDARDTRSSWSEGDTDAGNHAGMAGNDARMPADARRTARTPEPALTSGNEPDAGNTGNAGIQSGSLSLEPPQECSRCGKEIFTPARMRADHPDLCARCAQSTAA